MLNNGKVSIKKTLANIHVFNFPKNQKLVDINSLAILKAERIAFIATPKIIYYITIVDGERMNVNILEVLTGVDRELHCYNSIDAKGISNQIVLAVTTRHKNPTSRSTKSAIVFCSLEFDKDQKLGISKKNQFEAPNPSLFVSSIILEKDLYFTVFSVESPDLLCYSVRKTNSLKTNKDELFFREVKVCSIFPEIKSIDELNGSAVRLGHFITPNHRFSAIGTLKGGLRLTIYDISEKKIVIEESKVFDSPIGDLSFFRISRGNAGIVHPSVAKINSLIMEDSRNLGDNLSKIHAVNLVVGESIGRVYVFWDIQKYGLSKCTNIFSQNDSVLCVYPFDLIGDGMRELLIGTFSRKLIVFNYDGEKEDFVVVDEYNMGFPIVSLGSLDFTDDSTEELVISTLNGFSVFQQKMPRLKNMLTRKFQKFLKLQEYYKNKKLI